jgi:hypothetical protein
MTRSANRSRLGLRCVRNVLWLRTLPVQRHTSAELSNRLKLQFYFILLQSILIDQFACGSPSLSFVKGPRMANGCRLSSQEVHQWLIRSSQTIQFRQKIQPDASSRIGSHGRRTTAFERLEPRDRKRAYINFRHQRRRDCRGSKDLIVSLVFRFR